ncbi:App1 family protein [Bifidobacterium dolichotidis]|uniref:App1 family protein n=1 Tax=Bifidobacterium dolichotidis TaxID=2306976 RepID=UPI003B97009C
MPTVSVATARELIAQTSKYRSIPAHLRNRIGISRFKKPIIKFLTKAFGIWTRISTSYAHQMGWYPSVKPYVGYGTEQFSRLICRTVFAPRHVNPHKPVRGIRAMLDVAAPYECVRIDIDGTPLRTVQIGEIERFERNDPQRARTSDYAISDQAGYLDLLAEHPLTPGIHTMKCHVPHRAPVSAELFTISEHCPVGIISDVDDTIMVTQVPTIWRAAYNMLLSNPRKRASVPGMAVMYNKLQRMFPQAPFFYLSTSPWNVESQIRGFITDYGFPDGPMLLRDLDPRPKTFVPSGVNHKLEYVDQLMDDFPQMRFILLGDDGQQDPTTYATIARRYPGRVLAIGIRQLSVREASGGLPVAMRRGMAVTQPIPDTEVPVFTGTTGANLMKTMLPYLQQFAD